MEKPQNNWPDTSKARSLLFVAQAIKQLSAIDSFESFRMMTLDTVTRVEEAKQVVKDIQRGISKQSFGPIAKELCWTLKADPIVDVKSFDQTPHALKYFEGLALNEKTYMSRIHSRLDVLSAKLSSDYKSSLEQFIIDNYTNESRRDPVLVAISYYLSHLVNSGYSRQFIYDIAEEIFFLEDVSRSTSNKIRSFFERFEMKDSNFTVYFQVDDESMSYLKDVYKIEPIDDKDVPPAIIAGYVMAGMTIGKDTKFASVDRRAKDMFSAARSTYDDLTTISSVSVLSSWSMNFNLPKDFCSYHKRKKIARAYSINAIDGGGSIRIAQSQARGVKESKDDVNNISRYFDSRSAERLHNSISSVSAALTDKNYDSRLISIWSSFEALLSSPPSGSVRILHYVDLVTPCVLAKYFERNIIALYNPLILHYRDDFTDKLDLIKADGEQNRVMQFLTLLFDEKYQTSLNALIRDLSGYPLLSHRISMAISRFGTPARYLEALASHKDRVQWQLHRIYRARNQLVHSGRAPEYLDVLTVNAFEYYRNAIRHILNSGRDLGGTNDVDTVVESVGLKFDGHLAYVTSLQSAKRFTNATMRRAFLG